MSGQNISASQIEHFHVLAALGREDIETRYSEELAKWLTEFVREELPGMEPPPVNSPQEFADTVLELGRNKRSWSNRLASLVIDLSDSQAGDEKVQALRRLDEFAQQCPWKFLSESSRQRAG